MYRFVASARRDRHLARKRVVVARILSAACGLLAGLGVLLAPGPLIAAEKITYYHFDATGSPVAATDEQGSVIWRERYEPYGDRIDKPPAAQANTRWHTGHVQDPDTGLVYAGARYYDPTLGRFLSIDPVGPNPESLHSINRYAYGNNNPYKYVDPDGRCAMSNTGSAEGARDALAACQAGGGAFGPDFLDYALVEFPVGPSIQVKFGSGILRATGDDVIEGASKQFQIHAGKQGKHIPGHPHFQPGKSELAHPDPQELLDKFAGKGERVGNREFVDFGENIGVHVGKDGTRTATTRGTIHYDEKGGAHIVPAPPRRPL
jgi:RHS repeat-associated protein